MKQCTKCKKWKDESEFSKNRNNNKDGLRYWCKKCMRKFRGKGDGPVKRYYSYEETHRTVSNVKQKRCRRCKSWKTESEFYKDRLRKDGLQFWCKACLNKATYKARKKRLAIRN